MKDHFKEKLKCLALLNAIIEPDWEYRYFSYNSQWGDGDEMASLRDSCGGEWFILFSKGRVAFKCTSPVDGLVNNFSQLKDSMPIEYSGFINEAAFSMDSGSCIWYLEGDTWVKLGGMVSDLPNPEVIQQMSATDCCQFFESIYEQKFEVDKVKPILDGGLNIEMALTINSDLNLDNLKLDMLEIGIPSLVA